MRPLFVMPILLGVCLGCSLGECGNSLVADHPSPDGRHHAVVFVRDCGATTSYSTQVSVLGRGRDEEGGGNALVIDDGSTPSDPPAVEVHWLAPDRLELSYRSQAQVFLAATQVDGVQLEHVSAIE